MAVPPVRFVTSAALRRSSRWLAMGWPGDRPQTPALKAAFLQDVREQAHRSVLIAASVLLVANLLFWLEDAWAFRDLPHLIPILARGRAALVLLAILTLVAVFTRPAWSYIIGIVAGLCGMTVLVWTLGQCGGPNTPWPYFTLAFPLLSVGGWARPWLRAVGLAGMGVLMMTVFVAVEPTWLTSPMTSVSVGFLVFLLVLSLVLGLVSDHQRLQTFLARLDLSTERARLAERVEEKTRATVALSRRLDAVREAERAAIARDLHDDLGQTLTAARMAVRLARDRYIKTPTRIQANLDLVDASLRHLSEQTTTLLRAVRPALVDQHSLNGALDGMVRRSGLVAEIRAVYTGIDVGERCGEDACRVIWRCAQEALTNVVRHADCHTVEVSLCVDSDTLVLVVQDDGVGFDVDATTDRLGLLGIRERAAAIGGTSTWVSRPGSTQLVVRVPCGGTS